MLGEGEGAAWEVDQEEEFVEAVVDVLLVRSEREPEPDPDSADDSDPVKETMTPANTSQSRPRER